MINGMDKYQALEEFLKDYALKYSPKTITKYNYSIRYLFKCCILPLEDIKDTDITDWLLVLREKGLSPATQVAYLRGVKAFFKYLKQEGILSSNPARLIQYPVIPQKLPNYLEPQEYTRFVKLTEGMPLKRALVELLYCTGLRADEIINIKQPQIDWERRKINITQAKGNKERIVFFTARYAEILKEYLATRTDENPHLFLNTKERPLSVNLLEHYFRELSKAFRQRVTPHTLRHTFAVTLFLKGMPIMNIKILLGHDEIKYTHYYARLFNSRKREFYEDFV